MFALGSASEITNNKLPGNPSASPCQHRCTFKTQQVRSRHHCPLLGSSAQSAREAERSITNPIAARAGAPGFITGAFPSRS